MDVSILVDLKKNHINVGDVFYLPLGEADGITPKNGQNYRDKYIVVLGKDSNGDLILATAINTRDYSANEEMRNYQYPLPKSKYTFLKHTSYLNCYNYLPEMNIDKLIKADYVGCLDDEDISYIKGLIIDSPLSKRKILKKFKIIE